METEQQEVIECEVLFKRVFGKKLSFLTVITKESKEIEIKLSQTEFIKSVKIGDIIKASGMFQKNEIFELNDMKIIEKSSTIHLQRLTFKNEKNENKKSLCKIMKQCGKCERENCQQRHFYLENELERFKKMEKQKIFMKEQAHDENDPFDENEKNSKNIRSKEFAIFLVENFGIDKLKSGPVLDVAGGKGLVSYFLSLIYGIECILIDPRGSILPKKYQKSLSKKNVSIEEKKTFFDSEFDEELIKKSSLIFGMHPDEATEDIVKLSLKYSKSFAIVPCCVFPNLFPRKLNDKTDVIEYNQFCQYLIELIGKDAKQSFLKMKGRNKIIYKTDF
jgi:hypothetical protein